MKTKILFAAVFIVALAANTLASNPTYADFVSSRIIDDAVFDSVNTMSASDIDSWLNSHFGSTSCISTDHGFSAPDPVGYNPTQGFLYGGNVSAGKVIYDAAQAYGINPQVLLTTLQKEQSLVDGSVGCSTLRYAAATGYGCPDGGSGYSYSGVNLYTINGVTVTSVSGTCVNSSTKVGFTQQLIRSAWLLRFGEQRSEGNINWAIIKPNWDNSDDPQSCYSGPMTQGTWQRCPSGGAVYYDGYTTIDGTSVHMDDGATAALYWYTPHFAGNQNFYTIFSNWFGSPAGPGYSFVDSTGPPSQILPNQVVNVVVHLQNQSGTTWYSDGNVPAGEHATRLAMVGYQNNPFANPADPAWLGSLNQVKLNEASVASGQTATFQFTLKGPLQQVGSYTIKFVPVLDGVRFYANIGMQWTTSTPAPNYSYQVLSTSGLTGNMPTSYTDPVTITIKNSGNTMWYNEATKPVGAAALRLLTASPFYHTSSLYDPSTWLAANQVAMSSTQVGPGGSATFTFNLKTPATKGMYADTLGLVLDGATVLPDTSQLHIAAAVDDYVFSTVSADIPASLMAGQKYAAKIQLKNTGFATWYADGSTPAGTHPVRLMTAGYANSPFADASDPNWLGTADQVKMTTASVAPGQTGEFDFNIVAPYNSTGYTFDLRFVVDGVEIADGSILQTITVPAKTFAYDAVNGTINPSAVMTKGQTASLKLIVKNNTNFIWYSDDAKPPSFRGGGMRLIMTNPWYRSSPFADTSDPNWMGTTSQVKMTTASVAPGQTGEFDFTWKAPTTAGQYRERFALGVDGYFLLPDIGMEFDTTVQ